MTYAAAENTALGEARRAMREGRLQDALSLLSTSEQGLPGIILRETVRLLTGGEPGAEQKAVGNRQDISAGDISDQTGQTGQTEQTVQAGRGDHLRVLNLLLEAASDAGVSYDPAALSDCGLGLLLLGSIREAGDVLMRAVSLPGADGAAYIRLAGTLTQMGERRETVAQALERAEELEPERPEPAVNLVGVYAAQGKLSEALAACERALRLGADPFLLEADRNRLLVALGRADDEISRLESDLARAEEADRPDIHERLARLHAAAGRMDTACRHAQEACVLEPDDDGRLFRLGSLLLESGRNRAAGIAGNTLAARNPGSRGGRYLQAEGLLGTGRAGRAAVLAAELRTAGCRCGHGSSAQGVTLPGQGDRCQPEGSEGHVSRADAVFLEARCLVGAGDVERAERLLRDELSDSSHRADGWSLLGTVRLYLGDRRGAEEAYRRAAAFSPLGLGGLAELGVFPESADPDTLCDVLGGLGNNPLLPLLPRASFLFALARALDRAGAYAEAFVHADRANALVRTVTPYDSGRITRLTDQLLRQWSPAVLQRLTRREAAERQPLFIVGMPRSGTTLAERMLSGHSGVFPAGELDAAASLTRLMPGVLGDDRPYPLCLPGLQPVHLSHAAAYYLRRLRASVGGGGIAAMRITDKMPHNFLHLPLIASLFPRAGVIRMRRDPRDIAVSSFLTNFAHRHGMLGYSFALEDTAHALTLHRRLMDGWDSLFEEAGGRPPVTVRYEELVRKPEVQARRMVAAAGLEWEAGVPEFQDRKGAVITASHTQVRRPLYSTSVGRWRNYEPWLGPLLEELEQGGDWPGWSGP